MTSALRKTSICLVTLAIALVPAASFAGTATVRVRDDGASWGPARLQITRGDTVQWTNATGFMDHSVKSIGSNWSKNSFLSPGGSTSFTFRSVGRFRYRCTMHSQMFDGVCEGMCGRVIAVAPS